MLARIFAKACSPPSLSASLSRSRKTLVCFLPPSPLSLSASQHSCFARHLNALPIYTFLRTAFVRCQLLHSNLAHTPVLTASPRVLHCHGICCLVSRLSNTRCHAGELVTDSGVMNLQRNAILFMRRDEVEPLIRQGVLEHVQASA